MKLTRIELQYKQMEQEALIKTILQNVTASRSKLANLALELDRVTLQETTDELRYIANYLEYQGERLREAERVLEKINELLKEEEAE